MLIQVCLARLFIVLTSIMILTSFSFDSVLAESEKNISRINVSDLRIGIHKNKTRIVMDSDGRIEFNTFILANPYRVVFDLQQVRFKVGSRKLSKAKGGISGYRLGLFKPGNSRVVIDLTEPRSIAEIFSLPPNDQNLYRLVVDLKKISRSEFIKKSVASVRRHTENQRGKRNMGSIVPKIITSLPRTGKRVVVIDPGHGGVDPGAIGASGTYEKYVVLKASLKIKEVLEKSGRYGVILTRSKDQFISLRQRIRKARLSNASLFISIHADSISDKTLRGATIYTLSETASDAEAAELAENENKADIISGLDLTEETSEVTNILIDLAQRETMNQSARLAGALATELQKTIRTNKRVHRFAGFAVLKAPDIPSILFEMGYLSNPREERLLNLPLFQEKVANALLRGIDRYFQSVKSSVR